MNDQPKTAKNPVAQYGLILLRLRDEGHRIDPIRPGIVEREPSLYEIEGLLLDACEEFDAHQETELSNEIHQAAVSSESPDSEAPFGPTVYPLSEWHEDDGPALWWTFPIDEAPWVGTPLGNDWRGSYTHWTRIDFPKVPPAPDPAADQEFVRKYGPGASEFEGDQP